ncbi:unnamed protein product [Phyllotreta striolata]|uniref:Major facilitator superfamily (MFS) profile domain-containing protein n=1 Tax=Phyllotreta striolata TaxID=444603 RepID=A0A9N9TRQ3_PHYSR|nr:unnamed protein product [Phyllotreta striolata]
MSYVIINSCIGNLLSFSVGTALTWASPEIDKLNSTVGITSDEGTWVTSSLHLGAVFGPFLFGYLADSIGRKLTLIGIGIPVAISYLLMAFIKNVYAFYFSRFITGLGTGGLFTVMPMYIGEIADSSNRGLMGGLLNLFLCLGMLFTYCLGPYISLLAFNLICAVFPITFLVGFYVYAVETPTHLLKKRQPIKARGSLERIRGTTHVSEELSAIEKALEAEGKASLADLITIPGNRKAFIIGLGLIAFQQLSGINAVLSFAGSIFKNAGSSLDPNVCSIIIGVVQLVSSFLSSVLIDRLGRKILLIASGVGMVLSEAPLGVYSYVNDTLHKDLSGVAFLPIVLLIVYMLTYNVGSGPLPWTIMGELYPSNVKSLGSTLTSVVCWLMGFLIVKYFNAVQESIGLAWCFWIFSFCCAGSIFFTVFYVIETKGKSLEQIQDELKR